MIDYKVYSEYILFFPNIINNPEDLVNSIENNHGKMISKWQEWSDFSNTFVYGDRKYVSGHEVGTEEENDIFNTIYSSMNDAGKIYKDLFNISTTLNIGKNFVINKYNEDCEMGSHVDYNEDNKDLEYSFVVYLNDNYDGGEIFFKNQNVKIKPTAGSIIIFPSKEPFFHESLVCRNGRKIFIPHFWTGKEIIH